jgi:hypothetical protein
MEIQLLAGGYEVNCFGQAVLATAAVVVALSSIISHTSAYSVWISKGWGQIIALSKGGVVWISEDALNCN